MRAARWKGYIEMQKYKVSLTTKLKPPQTGIIAIEPEDYTAAEVAALKASGAKVLGYLSVGTVSDERKCDKPMKPYMLKKLEDWPHEHYLDLRQPEAREFIQKRAKEVKDMGFDGFWLDNLDLYEEYRSTAMFQGLISTLMAIRAVSPGKYIMVNGGIVWLTDLMVPHKVQLGAYKQEKHAKNMQKILKSKGFSSTIIEMDSLQKVQAGAFSSREGADGLVKNLKAAGLATAKRITLYDGKATAALDGVTQEEVFSLITSYKGTGKFSRQKQKQSEHYQAHMRRCIKNGLGAFLLEYVENSAEGNVIKLRIKAFCEVTGITGCCISPDKDL